MPSCRNPDLEHHLTDVVELRIQKQVLSDEGACQIIDTWHHPRHPQECSRRNLLPPAICVKTPNDWVSNVSGLSGVGFFLADVGPLEPTLLGLLHPRESLIGLLTASELLRALVLTRRHTSSQSLSSLVRRTIVVIAQSYEFSPAATCVVHSRRRKQQTPSNPSRKTRTPAEDSDRHRSTHGRPWISSGCLGQHLGAHVLFHLSLFLVNAGDHVRLHRR